MVSAFLKILKKSGMKLAVLSLLLAHAGAADSAGDAKDFTWPATVATVFKRLFALA